MKKLVAAAAAALAIVTAAFPVSAESFIENEICTASFVIKRANADAVVKDGVIGDGEYERIYIDKNDLSINFISSENYLDADIMADSIKWYFSWDEMHGLNFAVVYDAGEGFATNVENVTSGDNFCYNLALNFSSGRTDQNKPFFYYSVAKLIDSEKYLTGHYGQLGRDPDYCAVAGRDFEISYNGTEATFEWSIPFEALGYKNVTAGTKLKLNIAACAGAADVDDTEEPSAFYEARSSWTVSLGQFAFMAAQPRGASAAEGVISNCRIGSDETDDVTGGNAASYDEPFEVGDATTGNVVSGDGVSSSAVVVTDSDGNDVTDEKGLIVTEIVTCEASQTGENSSDIADKTAKTTSTVIALLTAAVAVVLLLLTRKRKK